LTAIAVTKICERVCRETGADPAIFSLLIGDRKTVGQKLADDPRIPLVSATGSVNRSEEHTSELQSRFDLVCRLLLEKKNIKRKHSCAFCLPNSFSHCTRDQHSRGSSCESICRARPGGSLIV